jgi:hypothetical protein
MERIDSSKLGFRWCLLDFDEPVFSGNLGVHMVRELYIHTWTGMLLLSHGCARVMVSNFSPS